jgi:adenylate cyclase
MTIRRIRLASGLVLLTYVATHFINHALGLISLQAMEAGRVWFVAFWRSWPATTALYSALTVHLALALYSLFHRQHLRMPLWEALQLVLGLSIPLLLAAHLVGTRVAHEWFGVNDSYTLIVLALWLSAENSVRQIALITVVWIHGCIGLHFWLRLRSWYPRVVPIFFAVAVLLPVLALLGFAQAGREISARMVQEPDWFERALREANVPAGQRREQLRSVQDRLLIGFVATLALVLLARVGRDAYQRRNRIRISYPGGIEIAVTRGLSVLEASRLARIPHASVCGGRGRCSTCRIRIVQGLDAQPPAKPAEARVLERVGAPPNVRLACQLRPTENISVVPLLSANARPRDGFAQPAYLAGQERNIAVLFADLRSFTGLAEYKLPYDLVFILNSYFEAVGAAITRAGGTVDKFIGDGVMALFGVESGPEQGCGEALAAARQMVKAVDALSGSLANELAAPLKIGIGIHSGPAVVGRMGYGAAIHLTAVGDTVNVASRLQDLSKEYSCQLVISEQAVQHAGLDVSSFPRHELTLRNRRELLTVYIIGDVQTVLSGRTDGPLAAS